MIDLVKTNVDGLSKSKNAVLSTDNTALNAYKKRRELFKNSLNTSEEIKQLKIEVEKLTKKVEFLMEKINDN